MNKTASLDGEIPIGIGSHPFGTDACGRFPARDPSPAVSLKLL
jgi:hypothetical protein